MRNQVRIYIEDSYGVGFLKILLKHLKDKGEISRSLPISCKRIPGRCSSKFSRVLRIALDSFDKVIIIVDGDGQDKDEVAEIEYHHVSREDHGRVTIIVNEYEIEEWLLYAWGIQINEKPSRQLKEHLGRYEKHMLPDILKNVINNPQFRERLKTYNKFAEFINALS